jgi:nucleoside-diphosphate-sugar epimerase
VVPLFGGGNQPLQTVHVDDVCAAVARILERDLPGTFNVAEPDPPTLGVFLRMMADRLGIRVRFVPLPFGPVLAGVRAIEALRVPFPLRSESLLGLKGLRQVPVADDLRRLDLRVRTAAESLRDVLSPSGMP